MGKPAARITDMHTCPLPIHVGGPIITGNPTVFIGGMPAATVGDMCTCVGPPDMIVQGSSSVFIGGRPAARMGDSTAHGGKIIMGCFTVLIGDSGSTSLDGSLATLIDSPAFGPGPLSEAQAQALFKLMAAQPDIAFAYPIDGCYARAHLMIQRMIAMGVTPKGKVWTFAPPGGSLHAQTDNDPNGYVEWGYHVAPVVQVRNAKGVVEDRVIDPSLFDRPVSPQEWARVQQPVDTTNPPILKQTRLGESPTGDGGDGYGPSGTTPNKDAAAAETMRKYKRNERTSKNSNPRRPKP